MPHGYTIMARASVIVKMDAFTNAQYNGRASETTRRDVVTYTRPRDVFQYRRSRCGHPSSGAMLSESGHTTSICDKIATPYSNMTAYA
jgi:hypothetical protein